MILCVGTSHRFVTVRVLEHADREAAKLRAAFDAAVACGASAFPFSELAVLSTCNRVELYAACEGAESVRAAALLRSALDGSGEDTRVYIYHGSDAVMHLCRVAAGLESMVLGEPQIAGQVTRAFEQVIHKNQASSALARAAAVARVVGRRARSETGIARGPVSISSVAIRMAAERLGRLTDKRILVLGAGKMGRTTCEVLKASGARLTISNRTFAHAELLATQVGATATPLFPLAQQLAHADAVIASTASPVPLIDAPTVTAALQLRHQAGKHTPLLLIDIAVPCNVAVEARTMAGVEVAGIDDLRSRITAQLDERRAEVPRVEAIIEEELAGASPVRV